MVDKLLNMKQFRNKIDWEKAKYYENNLSQD
jgi:hypothetical protein